jgi:hypothetical protein
MMLVHGLLMILVLYVAVVCVGLFLAHFMEIRKNRRH